MRSASLVRLAEAAQVPVAQRVVTATARDGGAEAAVAGATTDMARAPEHMRAAPQATRRLVERTETTTFLDPVNPQEEVRVRAADQ